VILSVPTLTFTARVLSAEMVETRSTAWLNSLLSSASDLSLPLGITRW
jgi:hypothetical protein